jgi:sarcosine oxidase subunit alpha
MRTEFPHLRKHHPDNKQLRGSVHRVASPQQPTGVFTITVDGRAVEAAAGMSVAAALVLAGIPCRTSVTGEPRGPLCGMGVCFECAATVDGVPLRRTCMTICRDGMEVVTA